MTSFIVEFCSRIFEKLRWVSPFQILRFFIPAIRESRCFVDAWVLGHLILSIILSTISAAIGVAFYGAIRVWETVIYQINVLLFDEYRENKKEYEERKKGNIYNSTYALRSYRRIVILLLFNYIEIVFWFALFYRNIDYLFETGTVTLNSLPVALHFSLATMTGFGSTTIFPTETWGYIITSIQMAVGLFMALGILARFIGTLPKPKTLDVFEK